MELDYAHLLIALAVDVVSISALTYGLYFRRHRRRDLTLGFVGVNIGLFAVASFTSTTSISIGFGIGLFALLSVIRLRSTVASQEEIGYYFVALVIGLVNGLSTDGSWRVALTLNAVLVGAMYLADHPRVLRHAERVTVELGDTPDAFDSLWDEVRGRLGFELTGLRVLDIDYARHRTRLDVRFRTDRPVRGTSSPGGADDIAAGEPPESSPGRAWGDP